MDGLNEMDFRTTDRCVKNDQNRYRPVWLPNDSSIKREVIKLMAKRIEVMEGERPAQAGDQPQSVDMNDSFEGDLVLISMIWATCRIWQLRKLCLEQQLNKFPGRWISMHNTRKDMYHCS